MNHFLREEVLLSITQRFEKQVALYAERPAIISGDKTTTYRELNELANKVAHAILDKCGDKSKAIPILLHEQSLQHIVAILGVLKAGKFYTVLDPNAPRSYLQHIITDLEVRLIVTNFSHNLGSESLLLDKVLAQNFATQNPNIATGGDDLASIVYTSGSTKKPKGVQRYHKTILHRIWLYSVIQKISCHDRQSHLFSCRFVAAEADVYGALLNGACLYTYSLLHNDIAQLQPWLMKNAITLFHPPVPVFRRFLHTLQHEVHVPHLRLVALAGEALYQSDARLFWRYFPQTCKLCHRLSATETSNIAQFTFDSTTQLHGEIIPVGHEVFDKEILLIDSDGKVIDKSNTEVAGEIVVKSHFLAKGYWRQENFAVEKDGRSVYSTGDMACYNTQQLLVHLGRKDHQLKIRGYRVNPQQVEAVFLENAAVKEVAVVAYELTNKEKQLHAYVVFTHDHRLSTTQLRLWLREKLPDYMIPVHIVILAHLPLTTNGKIDRKSLEKRRVEREHCGQTLPRTSLEKELSVIWEDVLDVRQVYVEDDFFLLGGHSLAAMNLIGRIRENLAIDIALQSIFTAPTFAEFSQIVAMQREKSLPLVAQHRKEYPASSVQRQMWFLQQLQPQSSFYNMSRLWQLQGDVDEEILRSAVDYVVRRHTILRATLAQTDGGEIRQIIHEMPMKLSTVVMPEGFSDVQLQDTIERVTKMPFILDEFPLARFQLIRLSAQSYILCVVIHHALCDYWSMRIIWNDVVSAYNSYQNKTSPELPDLKAHYADFCWWEQQQSTHKLREYWLQKCRDIPILEIATDKPRPPQQSFQGKTYTNFLPSTTEEHLRKIAQQHNCTLFMMLLAAFNILLHRYSGQKDVVVGFPIANRHHNDVRNMVGCFVHNLPLRNSLANNPSFCEFLLAVKTNTLEAYAHQNYAFEKLVEELNPIRDTSRNPIFQTFINMLDIENTHTMNQLQGIKDRPYPFANATTRFDLTLYIEQRETTRFMWRYSTDLFVEETMRRMSEHFLQLLESIARNPQQKIHYLAMTHHREIPVVRNDTEQTIVDMLVKAATVTPNKTALTDGEITYTYSQLHELSNYVCYSLQNKGVTAEDIVVVIADHSPHLIIAMYGILKSGGCCVVVHPDSMTPQIRQNIYDARVVICEEVLRERYSFSQIIALEDCMVTRDNTACLPTLHKDQAAFIVHTSGSTGAASGVVITHENISSTVQSVGKSWEITTRDVCVLTAATSFIAALRQIFTPLVNSATLVVLCTNILRDPWQLFCEIVHHRVTTVDFVPSYAKACAQVLLSRKLDLSNIRQIATSGEKLSSDCVAMWRELIPGVRFLNVYGQTETTAGITMYAIPDNLGDITHNVAVGRGVGGNEIYILDEYLQPVPRGVVGNIYVKSKEVARCYYRNAAHSACHFIPNPFTEGILYKTGDRGRYIGDEELLQIIARSDAIVKVRGYRVDTLEVEVVLRQHQKIHDAAVMFCDENLQAYIVCECETTYKDIAEHLQMFLPEYMRPQKIKTLSTLPKTNSGKVDYLALRELDGDERFLFTPQWRCSPRLVQHNATATYLLFADDNIHCANSKVITVVEGEQFAVEGRQITMDYRNEEDYSKLVTHLQSIDFDFKNVIYADHRVEFFTKFVRAFAAYLSQMYIAIICRNVFCVNNNVKLIAKNALILGIARVLPLEYKGLQYACIDIQNEAFVSQIFDELQHGLPHTNVAYVAGQRYTMTYESVACNEIQVQDNDVYVITGGLGNIGLHIALALAQKAKVKLAITTRDKENITPEARESLRRIKQSGTEISLFETQLTQAAQVKEVIAQIEEQLGKIRGVIHCAGTREHFAALNTLQFVEEKSHFKVRSTQLLIDILQHTTADFMVVFSSLSSVLGRYGQAGYAATNAYVDTLIQQNTSHLRIVSANWDVWRELPLPIARNIPKDIAAFIRHDAYKGISNAQGVRALLALPNSNCKQVIVSRRPEITGYDIRELHKNNQFVAAYSPLQKKIATIWQEVLHVEKIGIHDDFFARGGHSLLAIQLISRIRETFAVEVALQSIFEAPTIERFALLLEGNNKKLSPLVALNREEYPLSSIQRQMWFLQQLQPQSSFYNVVRIWKLEGRLSEESLRFAIDALVERQVTLRMAIVHKDNGEVRQKIHQNNIPLTVVEMDKNYSAAQLQLEIEKTTKAPFSLTTFPLVRFKLIRLQEQRHILCVVVHHLLSDHWSMQIVWNELAELYNSHKRNKNPHLGKLKAHYGDFCAWQETTDNEYLRKYWKKRCHDIPVLEIPTDKPRPSRQSFAGSIYRVKIEKDLETQIIKLGQDNGCTLFMTLLAGFNILLSRYSNQEDIVVGFPIANRHYDQTQNMVGFFINNLVLRSDLSGNPSFIELLQRVKQVALGAYSHQDYPFEKLVEDLNPVRDMSRNPIFQVQINMLDIDGSHNVKELEGLERSAFVREESTTRLDLAMYIQQRENLHLSFRYSTDLFEEQTIATMAKHYIALLADAVAYPQKNIHELEMLSREEIEQQVGEVEQGVETNVLELFAQCVEKNGTKTALIYAEKTCSYEELAQRSSKMSGQLRELGVTDETPVIVFGNPSIEMFSAMLAILKSGGICIPANPEFPLQRIEGAVASSLLILTTTEHAPTLPKSLSSKVVFIENLQDGETVEKRTIAIDQAAFMIYTSGSTGQANGVVITHRNLANMAVAAINHFPVSAEDVCSFTASISFVTALRQIFAPLCRGATLVIVDAKDVKDPRRLFTTLAQHKVTLLNLVPSHSKVCVQELAENESLVRSLHLNKIVTSGERLTKDIVEAWRELMPEVAFGNVYGQTETTSGITLYNVPQNLCLTNVPIGKTTGTNKIYVLNPYLQPVPYGALGEIYVESDEVARGYFHDVAHTACRFVPHPFATHGKVLYKSGDWARRNGDGDIEIFGRSDPQIKIRGYRVNSAEIEVAMRKFGAITDAAVIFVDNTLKGYVVVKQEFSLSELLAHLEMRLPSYMIPHNFFRISHLPTTSSGKIHYHLLAAVDRNVEAENTRFREFKVTRLTTDAKFVGPCNELEQQLSEIWKTVLGVEKISMHDDFFHLGGHSILAITLMAKVREKFAVDLPLHSIFESPTIHRFAQLLQKNVAKLAPMVALRRDKYPLSFAQKRLWFLYLLQPKNTVYNLSRILQLQGNINISSLQTAIAMLGERQHALRTYLQNKHGEVWQKIAPQKIPLSVVDIANTDNVQERINNEVQEVKKAFVLTTFPLVRFKLLCCGEERFVLCIVMHHIISDYWSLEVLWEELVEIYNALQQKRSPQLVELKLQYGDFCVWQQQQGAIAKQRDYWQQQFATKPPFLELPTDYPRPLQQSFAGNRYILELPCEVKEQLQKFAVANNCTLFMTLLTALKVLLYRYSGQQDITIGFPIANRHHGQIARHIGFFVNTLALRSDLSGAPTFTDLLSKVKDVCLGAYAHQDYPFEQLVEDVNPVRDMSRNPIFQVVLNMLEDAKQQTPSFSHTQVTRYRQKNLTTKFDLTLYVLTQKQLRITFDYCSDLFSAQTIERMAKHFAQLLTNILERPQQKISQISILTHEEQEKILGFNQRLRSLQHIDENVYPRDKTISALFKKQVAARPSALAVVAQNEKITYSELDQRSQRWALFLRKKGVGVEVPVAVCMDKSIDMLVAFLGIAKAGGVYIPLDKKDPLQRQLFILRDNNCQLMISDTREVYADVENVVFSDAYRAMQNFDDLPVLREKATANSVVYVMYTSGSSGVPKGIAVTHRNITRLLFDIDYVKLDENTRILHASSPRFDASTFEIWGALLHGGTCYLPTSHDPDARLLCADIRHYHINTMWITSSFFNTIVDMYCESLVAVKQLVVGGETLSVPHIQQALQKLPHTQLINGYGPTENTTFTTCYSIPRKLSSQNGIPIGKAIGHTHVYILDRYLNMLPVGCIGELYAGGDGVSRGYPGDVSLTAQKMLPDPFANEPGSYMYKTGDLARYRENGDIEFLGRIDQQIKIRGFRIEPGEIEHVLLEHPCINKVVVCLRERAKNKQLVAYVVIEGSLWVDELRLWLSKKIPDYMIPTHFVQLDVLPLNTNGKVDRKRLRELNEQSGKTLLTTGFVAPRTDIEKQICAIWQEVLQVEKVGIEDDFFVLGGHSLLAVILMAKIRKLLAIDEDDYEKLPLAMMLTHPTVKQFVQAIDNLDTATSEVVILMNKKIAEKPPIFLVHAAGVDPIVYRHLCKSLDDVATVYTIRTHELDKLSPIEETACYHMEKIKGIQPKGPYIFGGMCMGGLVAYEMAKRMREQGDEVKLAFIMDAINIPGMKKYKSRQKHKGKKWGRKIKNLHKVVVFVGHVLIGDTHFIKQKMQRMKNNIKRSIQKKSDPQMKLKKQSRDRLRIIRDNYYPQSHDGEIVYIRSEKEAGKYAVERLQELASTVKCYQVKGTIHSDVARPHFADATGKIIQKYLSDITTQDIV